MIPLSNQPTTPAKPDNNPNPAKIKTGVNKP